MIGLAIVDNHPIVRRGIRNIISNNNDMKVLIESSCTEELIVLLKKRKCQIIILDICLPEENGVIAIDSVLRICPDAKIIMFSEMTEGIYAKKCFEAGAKGYILKDAAIDELPLAIRIVAEGGIYTSKV